MRVIRARLTDRNRLPARYLILDFTRISGLDSSVSMAFAKLKRLARDESLTLIFTNVPFELERQLETAGFLLNDPENSTRAFISLDYAMEWCENRILEGENALETQALTLPELLAPVFPEPRYIPALMQVLTRVTVKKGNHLFRQGDPSDAMYFVESGMVSVQLELDGNRILRLKKMGPGTVIGEMGIYTDAPRSASIVAAEDCVLYRLSKRLLEALQGRHPRLVSAIHRFVVALLAERVADTNDKVRDLQV